MFGLPLFRLKARPDASLLGSSESELLVERFNGLKRQIPLLYAVIAVNVLGFHLSTSGQHGWATLYAVPASCIILYRLLHWRRLGRNQPKIEEMRLELDQSLRFSRFISILFLAWSMSILVWGGRHQQQYVILFASLASVGRSVALASVPKAAKQPLMLIAIPIAVWSMFSDGLSHFVVGVSLAVVIALILRMLHIQERGLSSLLDSKAVIALEREKVRASEERYEYVSRATNDLIRDWDLKTDSLLWNDAVQIQLGYSPEQNHPTIEWWIDNIHPEHRDRVVDHVQGVIKCGEDIFEDEYPFRKSDGTYAYMYDRGYIIRDGQGAAVRMVGAMQDFTRRKLAEEGLMFAATRDQLTSLPNRAHFRETLQTAVTEAKTGKYRSSLLLLDLDNFKHVNDSLGHDAGDALLKELASRLAECLAGEGELARLGGDEFAILLKQVGSQHEVQAWAQVILGQLQKPFIHEGRTLDCGATIGAAIFPEDGSTPETILKNADIALYIAKTNKRGGFTIYEQLHRAELQLRNTMISLARSAVQENRIAPFYQPKVSFEDGSITGFEALLRWRHPSRGIQIPGTIAAAFEDFEIAAAISDRMVGKVLSDVRTWLDKDLPFGHVAINAAAAEFRQSSFAERLLERLRKAGIPPSSIELEVTESVFLGRGAEHVERALRMLSSAGVTIALDDFGTGYASLSHLKQFPVDIIKIDRSFIRDMEVDPGDEAIVGAVISLGRSLGIKVVAEGIERSAQAERLANLNCDYGQGFLFSKAVPASRVPALLKTWPSRAAWVARAGSSLRLVSSKGAGP